jgi:GNAT superfamily N-acetyltransferase
MKDFRRAAKAITSVSKDNSVSPVLTVRSMRAADAVRIAALSTQLGYPLSTHAMARRIRVSARRKDHRLFLAELNGVIVGWLEIFRPLSVLNAGKAEIGALVVDDNARRLGVGSALMKAGHEWAQRMKCPFIYLRSNVVRKEAHAFYRRTGYSVYKTQYVFRKLLPRTKNRKVA